MEINRLYKNLIALYQILEVEGFIERETVNQVNRFNAFINHFYDSQPTEILRYNLDSKLPNFAALLHKLNLDNKEPLIEQILNANSSSNYPLDKLLNHAVNKSNLAQKRTINTLLRRLEKSSDKIISRSSEGNRDYLKVMDLFIFQRGIYSPTIIEKVKNEFDFNNKVLRCLSGIHEILMLWFTEDMINHSIDRNEGEARGWRSNSQTGESEEFIRPGRRARVEHKMAWGFSREWLQNISERFDQNLDYWDINDEYKAQSKLIAKVQIPEQLSTVFKKILEYLRTEVGDDTCCSILEFTKLKWLEHDHISLNDIYLTELKTNLVFNFGQDIEFLKKGSIFPNEVVYEPTFISVLEDLGDWGYGVITDEKVFRTTYKLLNSDLVIEIESIIRKWTPYKPSYWIYGNYTLSNQLAIGSAPWGQHNVSAELKINEKDLRLFLSHVSPTRKCGEFKDYCIGDKYYIVALKKFKNESVVAGRSNIGLTTSGADQTDSHGENEISIGYEDIQHEFEKLAVLIKSPEKRAAYGIQKLGGILMYGAPGCGKTYWAQRLGKLLNYQVKEVSRSDFASSYVDGAIKGISNIIKEVESQAPCVLFFDEFDDIAKQRSEGSAGENESNKVVNYLLQAIPKLIDKDVVIIAATNFIKKLDTAVIRGGRFDRKEPIFPPLPEERASLLYHTLIKGLVQNSPIIKELRKCDADQFEFWRSYGDYMGLFSNSYVENVAQELKMRLYELIEFSEEGFVLEDEIEYAINNVSNNISYNERVDFKNFYNDLQENRFNKYPNRIEVLKKELDDFFGDDGIKGRTKIGFRREKK